MIFKQAVRAFTFLFMTVLLLSSIALSSCSSSKDDSESAGASSASQKSENQKSSDEDMEQDIDEGWLYKVMIAFRKKIQKQPVPIQDELLRDEF